MSNERNNLGQDPLVTNTYKELARERAPDHLNEKVLRLAADRSRTPYARARAWMRPAAWAATIGLSFAIVLELTKLPQIEPETVGVTATDGSASTDYRANGEIGDTAKRSDAAAPAQPASEQESVETSRQFAPKDMDVLREAEDRVGLQAGPNQAPAVQPHRTREPVAATPKLEADAAEVDNIAVEEAMADEAAAADDVSGFAAARSMSVAAEKKDQSAQPACTDESRKTAESWYRCIKELRDAGEYDLAVSEYTEFRQQFPEFVDPDADR